MANENNESEESKYYLREVLQHNFLHTVHIVANQFTVSGWLPPFSETFLAGGTALIKRADEEENESFFEMHYGECLLLLDMMSRIETVFQFTLPTFKEKMENMTEDERENYEMSLDLVEMMTQVKEEMTETFPEINEIFENAEIIRKKEAAERKTMNLDNVKILNGMSLKDPFYRHFFLNLFNFFEAFIVLGESSFSERVRKADFYCIKDIKAVRERIIKATEDALVQPDYYLQFTLEDTFVLFMVNNIYQKIFASDAADEADHFMENAKVPNAKTSAKEIRSFTLQLSAKLQILLEHIGEVNEDFYELIEPVEEFGV